MAAINCTYATVLKFNRYHDATGAFTSKENARPLGVASRLAQHHEVKATAQAIIDRTLTNSKEREEFTQASENASRLWNEGQTTKAQFSRPGTNTYTSERLALHRQIIGKLLENEKGAIPEPGERPRMIMLGGRPGSGKSNFDVNENPEIGVYDRKKFIVLDADHIKQLLPEYTPEKATVVHQESTDIFDKAVTAARKRGLNVVLDFTMSSDKVAWANSFKKAGYQTEAYYIHRPPELAAEFAIRRWQQGQTVTRLDGSTQHFSRGRIVPLNVVLSHRNNETYFDRLSHHVDTWKLYDNSGQSFSARPIAHKWERILKWNPFRDLFGRYTSKDKAATVVSVPKVSTHGSQTPATPSHEGVSSGQRWKKENRQEGHVLNGVPLQEEKHPDFSRSVNRDIDEPELEVPLGKHVSAGVVMVEPDGRVWLVQPEGRYGGYRNTFAKGTVKAGEDLQETAAREVWEESGLVPKITGHLIDVERTTSVARFYVGQRVGGAPWAFGKETHSVKLLDVHGSEIEKALLDVMGQQTSDRKVLEALRHRATKANPYHDETGAFTSKDKASGLKERKKPGHLAGEQARKLKVKTYLDGDVKDFKKASNGLSPEQMTSALLKHFKDDELSDVHVDYGVSRGGSRLQYSLSATVKLENGGEAQVEAHRVIDLAHKEAKHVELMVRPSSIGVDRKDVQSQGVGKKLFAASLDLYDHLGIDKVSVYANCDIGGYAWARYGFVPTKGAWEDLQMNFQARLPSITNDAIRTRVERLVSLGDPRTIAVIAAMKQPVFGKATQLPVGFGLLKNARWEGELDLTDPKRYETVRTYVGH